ncbi:hypothetical protein DSO57_1039105 [Entomophthora muscae]|uniref:Uncharacterized protein n=2 Tax=Entomophthora muscae TaxID=34485 RepID=A0ACC2RKF7_9FUNG|nr:hypothetical protein DSO57_1014128 [Entomophthora muscae]KAJ9079091.1 hypothetical protein DSO57_1039105 [Entomophthora muscae]
MSQANNDILFLTLFAEHLDSEDKFRLQRVCTKWRKILLPYSWETIHVTKHFERAGQALAFQQLRIMENLSVISNLPKKRQE